MRFSEKHTSLDERFARLAKPYLAHPEFQLLHEFSQHGRVSTHDHVVRVAQVCLALNERMRLGADESRLIAGALLHDFYLYDWHDRASSKPNHATKHPLYAAENAHRVFGIDCHVRNIIESHMWPLPLHRFPKNREAVLVCAVDKYCSVVETLLMRGAAAAGSAESPAGAREYVQVTRSADGGDAWR